MPTLAVIFEFQAYRYDAPPITDAEFLAPLAIAPGEVETAWSWKERWGGAGVRIVTDPAKAQAVLDKVEKAMTASGQPAPQIAKVAGDGAFTIATTQDYAKKLSEDGTLGDSEAFQDAIPDAGNANFALFVDLDKLEKLYLKDMQGEEKANLEVLRAVGFSGTQSGDEATFSLRLLFN